MALTPEQLAKEKLANLKATLQESTTTDGRVPLGELIVAIGDVIEDETLYQHYTKANLSIAKQSLRKQAIAMTKWCDEHIGESVVQVRAPNDGQSQVFAVVDMNLLGNMLKVQPNQEKGKN